LDAANNIYAATQSKVWKVAPDGSTQLFAGSSDPYFGYGYSDGPRLLALFQGPQDTTVDMANNVFVSDITRIRKIRADGWVSTMAGTGASGYQNGRGSAAQFNGAAGLCLDTNGNIYVADSGNNCIREISPDSYGIGIPDWWQLAHFGHIGIDPNADPDQDGMSNYQEFWAGTDPLDATSFFAIKSLVVSVGGYAQISWQSVSGKTYTVQYSDDLKTWNSLGDSMVGNGSTISVSDTTSTQQAPHRMYRVFLVF
jgi:NHL repeat-containing protein